MDLVDTLLLDIILKFYVVPSDTPEVKVTDLENFMLYSAVHESCTTLRSSEKCTFVGKG